VFSLDGRSASLPAGCFTGLELVRETAPST